MTQDRDAAADPLTTNKGLDAPDAAEAAADSADSDADIAAMGPDAVVARAEAALAAALSDIGARRSQPRRPRPGTQGS